MNSEFHLIIRPRQFKARGFGGCRRVFMKANSYRA